MHDTSTLVRLEEKLSMRRAIQNDPFFRPWNSFVLRTDAGKPWTGIVRVIAGNNEQPRDFSFSAGRFGAGSLIRGPAKILIEFRIFVACLNV